jgi:hypothetical protein
VGLTIWVSLGKEIEQFLDLHFDLVPHTTELGEVPRIDGRWVCCFNPSAETRREGGGNTVRRTVRVTNTTRVGCMKYSTLKWWGFGVTRGTNGWYLPTFG